MPKLEQTSRNGELEFEFRKPNGGKLVPKLGQKSRKIATPGALLSSWATSWRQDGPRCDLERIWASIWMAIGAHLGAKIAPSWPTWRQDVPKMANLEAKMAYLAHFWEHLGELFWILGAILPKIAKTKRTMIVKHF